MSAAPVRVLYVYPSLHFDSGSPKMLVEFIEALDRRAFHPVFCAAGDGPLVQELSARGVEIVPGAAGPVSYRRPLAAVAALSRQAARLRQWRVGLIHVNGYFWNLDLVLAAWLLRIPVILHVHLPSSADFQNLHRFAARKVLFCSQFEMARFRHPERIAGKAEAFYNAIDTARFMCGQSIRAELGLSETDIAIGTVAQVAPYKGIDVLVETARILLSERDDLVFLVAGRMHPAEEDFGRRMRALADEPGLRGRVRFLGSRSDIPAFLASLDLFVLPSRSEPFGLAVAEAMAAGLPVVASRVGGIPEIVSSPELGILVDPVAPDAFAAAIRGVLAMPDRGRRMGLAARTSVAQRFDRAPMAERLNDVYARVLLV